MSPFIFRNFAKIKIFFAYSNQFQPFFHLFQPIIEFLSPFFVFLGRLDKIFYFHLFKLASAKNKIPGSDFIPKSLTYLSQTERNDRMKRIYDIFEINKYPLSCF